MKQPNRIKAAMRAGRKASGYVMQGAWVSDMLLDAGVVFCHHKRVVHHGDTEFFNKIKFRYRHLKGGHQVLSNALFFSVFSVSPCWNC
jgi:hypothetical protein